MKKTSALLALAFLCALMLLNPARAQSQIVPLYTFSQSTLSTYDTLNGQQVIASGTGLESQTYPVALPFDFSFDNTMYDSIWVAVNGYISFGEDVPGAGYWMFQNNADQGSKIACGFDVNLASRDANTQLSYQTLGIAPNRTFVIQWRNFGHTGTNALTVNFQIRLSESTGAITYSYGNVSLGGAGSNISVMVGLRGTYPGIYNCRFSASSNWTNTVPGTLTYSYISYLSGSNPPSGLKYTFTPPATCVPPAQLTSLDLESGNTSVSLSYSAPTPAPTGYLVVRTNDSTPLTGAPQNGVTYTEGMSIGNGTVAYAGTSTQFSNYGLQMNTSYTFTVFPYNSTGCYLAPAYNTTNPLSGSKLTKGPRTYHWTSTAATADFQTPANWTPARHHTDPLDTLYFDNGVTAAISNVPASVKAKQLHVMNNTAITLSSNVVSSFEISNLFKVYTGSALTLGGGNALTLKFINTATSTSTIDGTLTLTGSSIYDARYSNTLVNGAVKVSGANANFNTSCTDALNCTTAFKFNAGSAYYHQRNGGLLPSASYDPQSTIYVTGVTIATPTINILSNMNTMLGKLVINSPQLNTIIKFTNTAYNYNDIDLENTGTGSFGIGGLNLSRVYGNFRVLKGTFNGGYIYVYGNILVDTGTFNSSPTNIYYGDITVNAAGTINTGFVLGGSIHQVFTMSGTFNSTINTKIVLNNPAGATLNGIVNIAGGEVVVSKGKWSGPGRFSYGASAGKLTYSGSANLETSGVEWPAINPPPFLDINMTGAAPYNRVFLDSDKTASNIMLDIIRGVIVLGNYNLNTVHIFHSTTNGPNFIATNGTGKVFMQYIGSPSSMFFPLGDIAGDGRYSPITIQTYNTSSPRIIGASVTPQAHPSIPATANYLKRYWSITDTGTTPLSYYAVLRFNNSDTTGSVATPLQTWNGNSWAVSASALPIDTVITSDSVSNGSINNKQFTAFVETPATSTVYTWNGSQGTDFQVPANWTPARNTVTAMDILLFNSGGTVNATNVAPQTVTAVRISNNTITNFSAASFTNNYTNYDFDFLSDNNPATNELDIEAGSELNFVPGGRLKFNFISTGNTARIAGKLDLGLFCKINFANCKGLVTPTGTLGAGGAAGAGSNATTSAFTSTDSTLTIEGTYDHKYISTGGFIPKARWADGSLLNFHTNGSNEVPSGLRQSYYDVTYDRNIGAYWDGNRPDSIRGTFRVISTGTTNSSIDIGNSSVPPMYINKWKMTGGRIWLEGQVNVADSFIKTGGSLMSSGSVIAFCGTNSKQYFATVDSAMWDIHLVVSNPYGISLDGLYSNTNNTFRLNGNLSIATAVPYPVSTNLNILYGESSRLTYSGGAYIADSVVFPATYGPSGLYVTLSSPGSVLTVPFTRTIPGTLSLTTGDIDLGTNSLTLGVSQLTPGTLVAGAGRIRLTTGSFTRWLSTSSDGTGIGAIQGLFPVAYGASDRTASVFFSSSSAITSGGTLTLKHNALPGNISGLSIPDGTFTITNRFNSGWQFSVANNLAVGGTMGLALKSSGLAGAAGQLRLMWPETIVGANYVTGLGTYSVARNSLTLSNFSDSIFYIGTSAASLSNVFNSVTSGAWNNPATWDQNAVPSSSSYVFINANDTVTLQTNGAAKVLKVLPQGILKVAGGNSTIDSFILNNGIFDVSDGNVTLGTTSVSNKLFSSSSGTLNITGGLVKIYGSFLSENGFYNQTGGSLTVDPRNASGNVSANVPVMFTSTTVNATGGNITITDPSSGTMNAFQGNGFSAGHELILGDSISTGANTSGGFRISCPGNHLMGSIRVKGTPSVLTGREVKLASEVRMGGNLTVQNVNGKFYMDDELLRIKGNIQVDSGAFFYTNYDLTFANENGSPNPDPQLVSGKGTFRNNVSNYTANFQTIRINNISASGVTFDIGNFSYAGILEFTKGRLNTGGYVITQNSGGQLNGLVPNGWVVGKFRAYLQPVAASSCRFPVGNATGDKNVNIQTQDLTSLVSGGYVTVSIAEGDHASIASSILNPSLTVNRTYTIDTVNSGGLVFGTGNMNVSCAYTVADIDANAPVNNFMLAKYKPSVWEYFAPTTAGPLATAAMVPSVNLAGTYQVGASGAAPFFTQQPQSAAVCSGTNVQFTANAANANAFAWQVKTGSVWVALQPDALYSGVSGLVLQINQPTLAMNGNMYRCIAYNFEDSSISTEATLSVGTTVPPTVAITASPGNTICAGNPVTFTANITNGGTSPVYQWKVNGIGTGSNAAAFTSALLASGDIVTCELTSNLACASPANALSNGITMSVSPAIPLSVTVSSSSPVSGSCAGTAVVFTANIVNGGTTPSYQWKKNGINVGTNSSTYSSNNLLSTDVIKCVVAGSECTSGATATSPDVSITVIPTVTPQVSIAAGSNTICSGTPVTFTATPVNGGTTPSYQWKINGVNAGSNSSTFSTASLSSGDVVTCMLTSNITCVTSATANSNSITMVVNPIVTPAITISVPDSSICAGTTATFTAVSTYPGTAPAYQWKVNNINVGSNSNTFSIATLANNDVVSCVLTSNANCVSTTTAVSAGIIMAIEPVSTPAIAITADANPVCTGSAINFTATATVTGTAPVYQWKVNNVNAGTNSASFSTASLANGDLVKCILTSNATGCLSANTATSNTITAVINPVVAPTVSISSSSGNSACQGSMVTFTASPVNGGTAPVYQWKKNGVNAGSGGNTYADNALLNGDIISCVLTSNATCLSVATASSNSISMTITPTVNASVSISATQTNICAGTNVTFTALQVNGGATPAYQWKKNGTNTGTNSNTYTDASLANGDVISCILTSNATCVSPATVTSNTITMVVAPQLMPAVSIAAVSDQLCGNNPSGTLNAVAVNGGSSPVYQWKKNTVNVGSNANTYTDPAIADGDIITCELTSNASCLLSASTMSNAVTFSVNPSYESSTNESICDGDNYQFGTQLLTAAGNYTEVWTTADGCDSTVHLTLNVTPAVTPAISIAANPGTSVNNGQAVNFTASIQHGGTSPSIAWFRNSSVISGASGLTWQGVAGQDFVQGDQISARLTGNAPCATVDVVQSAKLTMSVNTVGIDDQVKHDRVSIFPNPTTGILTIKGFTKAGTAEVFDVLGRKIFSTHYASGATLQISLANYTAGNYTILFTDNDGKYWSQKVIRE